MADDLETIQGTDEQADMLDAIEKGLCPYCGRALNAKQETEICPYCGNVISKEPIEPVKLMDRLDEEQAKSDKFFADHVNNDPKAKAAVKTYTGDAFGAGHSYINNASLGITQMTPSIKGKINALDKLAESYSLDKDITVFRGTTTDYFKGEKWDAGKTEPLNMFVSSSANIYDAHRFGDIQAQKGHPPLMIELRVAKGTKGLYIGDNTYYEKGKKKTNEYEFLLGRNLQYTVISKEDKGRGWQYWVMEVRNE